MNWRKKKQFLVKKNVLCLKRFMLFFADIRYRSKYSSTLSDCTVRIGAVMNGITELTLRMQLWVHKLSLGGQRKQSQSPPSDFSTTNTMGQLTPYLKNKSEFHCISWCFSTNKSHFLKKKKKSNYLDGKHHINVPHSTWLKPVLKSRQAYAEPILYRTAINGRNSFLLLLSKETPDSGVGCPWSL